jgi:hypothetical protein
MDQIWFEVVFSGSKGLSGKAIIECNGWELPTKSRSQVIQTDLSAGVQARKELGEKSSEKEGFIISKPFSGELIHTSAKSPMTV